LVRISQLIVSTAFFGAARLGVCKYPLVGRWTQEQKLAASTITGFCLVDRLADAEAAGTTARDVFAQFAAGLPPQTSVPSMAAEEITADYG
jgi:hypothetical protein